MALKVKFGLGLGVADVKENVRNALLAEKHGFDGIWMADHIGGLLPTELWDEAWITLAAIAVQTKKVRLYCGVTDPVRRHPAQTSQTVATLDRISDGRAGLGIGAGESMNLLPFGMEWRIKPLLRLREGVEVIKLLLESSPSNPVNYGGKYFQLKNAFLQIKAVQKPRPTILIGALGSKNREMAGEIADGWCSWFQSVQTLKEGVEDIHRGAKKVGRQLENFEIAVRVPFAISDDVEKAWEAIQDGTRLCLIFERNVLRSMGFTESFTKDLAIQWAMPSQEFTERLNKAKKLVPRKAVEAVASFGNADSAIDKIEKYAKLGANWIVIDNYGPDYDKTLEVFTKKIMPYFG